MLKLNSLASISIAAKLRWLVSAAILGMLALTSALIVSEKESLLEEKQGNVRHAVEVAHGILQHYYELSSKGQLPEDEGRQRALSAIKALRYEGSEYFWVGDMS